jgi:hypothetical protein
MPAATPELAKLRELVTVVDVVDPDTFATAVRLVKLSAADALTVAEGSADKTTVVAVTDTTVVASAIGTPYASWPATTPLVLEQVSVVEDVVPLQPVRVTTASLEYAPLPLATVGAPCAKAGDVVVAATLATDAPRITVEAARILDETAIRRRAVATKLIFPLSRTPPYRTQIGPRSEATSENSRRQPSLSK